MPFRLLPALVGAFLASGLLPLRADEIALERVYAQVPVERPVTLVIPPDGTLRRFLVQQRGKVLILPADPAASATQTFLDFSGRKMEAHLFEEGLLGFAFHPRFAENGLFYVYYSQQDPKRSVLSELRVSADDPNRADPASERVLMEIPQPYWNHNSGNLLFGPDGLLYIGVGDGGKRDDAARLAQNPFSWLGKILRIDVNRRSGARAYGIPPDNPFTKEKEGYLYEIYALGLRNPWGLWFDPVHGDLWCADVGQDLWEEINLIRPGANYGWSYREGTQPFPLRTDPPPAALKFEEPIHVYGRGDGLSITGGLQYRGEKLPALRGKYVYGDYRFGNFWALTYDRTAGKVAENRKIRAPDVATNKVMPTAFVEDADREILVLDWNGAIHRLVPAPAAP
jgi:quinoprotein glucose dehydrogenase